MSRYNSYNLQFERHGRFSGRFRWSCLYGRRDRPEHLPCVIFSEFGRNCYTVRNVLEDGEQRIINSAEKPLVSYHAHSRNVRLSFRFTRLTVFKKDRPIKSRDQNARKPVDPKSEIILSPFYTVRIYYILVLVVNSQTRKLFRNGRNANNIGTCLESKGYRVRLTVRISFAFRAANIVFHFIFFFSFLYRNDVISRRDIV